MSHVQLSREAYQCKLANLRQRLLLQQLKEQQQDRARNPRENLTEGTLQSATIGEATEQQGTEEPPIERLQALKVQPQPEILSRCREECQRRRLVVQARLSERYGLGGSRGEAHRDDVHSFCLRLEQRLMALNKEAAQETMNEVENMMAKKRQDLRRHIW
ncbi:uncharacterized protein LOC142560792 [Dermacentor variabilis]|uniref:uncharacterized protein LOC142560792 n=1 Tax=Dermacentor variabilis TaxID=34621 RepID=UPI003F5AFA6E